MAVYDIRGTTWLEAVLGIATTFLVCGILLSGSLLLNRITQQLVVEPIENMLQTVKRISENPLKAVQEEENIQLALQEFGEPQTIKKRNNMET